MLDFGNVRLVGMTAKELQKEFRLRFEDANEVIYMLPDDIAAAFACPSVSGELPPSLLLRRTSR